MLHLQFAATTMPPTITAPSIEEILATPIASVVIASMTVAPSKAKTGAAQFL